MCSGNHLHAHRGGGGISGNPVGWAAAILLAAFVLVCVNAVGKTKGVIAG